MNINMTVNSEDELNQTMQQYFMQGFTLESNFNNTIILKKKGYNLALLIILLIFGAIILGVIYYLVCEDDKIFIELKYNQQTTSNISNEKIKKFCENCGTPIIKGNKFCTNCGKSIEIENNDTPQTTE